MDAIDQDFYLRISQELYLKRLIGGGYEKVYEIGPRFRNEGISDEHLPEHIAMEFYWAYADYHDGMDFLKKLFEYIIESVYEDKKIFSIRGFTVDFSKDWEIIDYGETFEKTYGVSPYGITLNQVSDLLKKEKIPFDNAKSNIPRGVDSLWKKIRGTIAGPAFLINNPKYLSPLQKASVGNPDIAERCQPIIAGSELGNGWTEVNDPIDQFNRFSEQQKLRDAGDEEAQFMDIDYVEMLEYGMPPTFGYGHSERVFWFLEDVPAREGVPFPQLKNEIDLTTKSIYNL
jgi:lysyl-tRNA synthetase class 2